MVLQLLLLQLLLLLLPWCWRMARRGRWLLRLLLTMPRRRTWGKRRLLSQLLEGRLAGRRSLTRVRLHYVLTKLRSWLLLLLLLLLPLLLLLLLLLLSLLLR